MGSGLRILSSLVRAVRSVRFGSGIVCQRKKAKQKHRNSASVAGQPDRVVSSRLERCKLGFGGNSIVRFRLPSSKWFALTMRATVSLSRSFRGSVPPSSSRMGGRGEIQAVPVQDFCIHRKDETKARKRVETEKLGHRGRTGKESDPIGHVSRSLAAAPCFRGFYCHARTSSLAGRPEVRNTKEQKQ